MLSEEEKLRARLEELRKQRKFNELGMRVNETHVAAEEAKSVPRSSERVRERVNTDPEGALDDAVRRPLTPKQILNHHVNVETKTRVSDGVVVYCPVLF